MTKKIFAVVILTICIALFAVACNNNAQEGNIPDGQDAYGREYGQIYNIDEYDTGTYQLKYEIQDTSVMGKTMIGANCKDYVGVSKQNDKFTLTFYAKDSMLSDVKADIDGSIIDGQLLSQDGWGAYSFEIQREQLNSKIKLSCRVDIMNKNVEFSIVVDTASAVLVG